MAASPQPWYFPGFPTWADSHEFFKIMVYTCILPLETDMPNNFSLRNDQVIRLLIIVMSVKLGKNHQDNLWISLSILDSQQDIINKNCFKWKFLNISPISVLLLIITVLTRQKNLGDKISLANQKAFSSLPPEHICL